MGNEYGGSVRRTGDESTAARLASLIQSLPSGILVEDDERTILHANQKIAEMFEMELSAEELVNEGCDTSARDVMDLLADPEGFVSRIEEILENKQTVIGEEVRFADGRVAERDYVPVFVGEDYRGHLWHYRDITGRLRDEDELRESEQRHRGILRQLDDGYYEVDLAGNLTFFNDATCRLLGYSAQDLMGMSYRRYMDEKNAARVFEEFNKVYRTGMPSPRFDYEIIREDGQKRRVETPVDLIRDARGDPAGFRGLGRDITERKQTEKALRESEQRFRQLFEQSVDAVIVHDGEGNIVDANQKAARSLGYTREELLSMKVGDYEMNLLSEEERSHRQRSGGTLWQRIVANEPGTVTGLHTGEHRRKDGTTFPVEAHVGGVDYGGRRLILSSMRDVTERREMEAQLEHQATHDHLTGLPARALFEDRLESAHRRAERSGGEVAVLFLDLDDFKAINDSLGHAAGDDLLIAIADKLRSCVRPSDTVARFGGDEFAVLLEGVGKEDARRVAARIEDELAAPFILEKAGREVHVTASTGISLGRAGETRTGDLLRNADVAMYRVKGTGKASHQVFDPENISEGLASRQEREDELRQAIERGQLVVRYQPVASLRTGKIAEFEALVRWEHPERGLLHPAEFIPLAERSGLIVPLGAWVLTEACRQLSRWREERPEAAHLGMSVNLAAGQLAQPGLGGEVAGLLGETSLEPSALQLEITESATLEGVPAAGGVLEELKTLGVRLAVDDFGTGYSSISYLTNFPVDTVKVDRSAVSDLDGLSEDARERGEAVIAAVIALAHSLGEAVVAEGVESAGQLERLRRLGCELGQGEHFWPPMAPREAFELYLSTLRHRPGWLKA